MPRWECKGEVGVACYFNIQETLTKSATYKQHDTTYRFNMFYMREGFLNKTKKEASKNLCVKKTALRCFIGSASGCFRQRPPPKQTLTKTPGAREKVSPSKLPKLNPFF